MMLFSEAMHRPVMSISTATTLGKVDGFIVDAKRPQIVALRLAGSDRVIEWDRVENFGPDAVTVAQDDVAADLRGRIQALSDSRFAMLHKRVLDDQGNESGTVDDVEFDPDSGLLTSVITSSGRLQGDRLIGCGQYAVVVRAAGAATS
jgi:sporulation protein YlmC with PRC-barrel domain